MTPTERAALTAERAQCYEVIDAAHWAFTHECIGEEDGQPPAVVASEAFARLAEINRLLWAYEENGRAAQ